MDKEKLIKFLSLTESSNDAESLSAIRKANKFVKDNDTNWTELIKISDALEAVIKRQKEEYVILQMILKKEQKYSQELKEDIRILKKILFYFGLAIMIITLIFLVLKTGNF